MANTWLNHVCTLRTESPANEEFGSWYFVSLRKMRRYAPRNSAAGRPHDQVICKEKSSICYLDKKSVFTNAIKAKRRENRIHDDVHVLDAIGDYIVFLVSDYEVEGKSLTDFCSRTPGTGMHPFDFDNTDGVLTSPHIGDLIMEVTDSFNQQEYSKIFG